MLRLPALLLVIAALVGASSPAIAADRVEERAAILADSLHAIIEQITSGPKRSPEQLFTELETGVQGEISRNRFDCPVFRAAIRRLDRRGDLRSPAANDALRATRTAVNIACRRNAPQELADGAYGQAQANNVLTGSSAMFAAAGGGIRSSDPANDPGGGGGGGGKYLSVR